MVFFGLMSEGSAAFYAERLRNASEVLLPGDCREQLLSVECARGLLSMALGYGIICGSLLVKLPQITKILASGSAAGLSLPSVLVDLCAITNSVAYGYMSRFPFSAYGDGFFLALQTLAIGALIVRSTQPLWRSVGLVLGYAAVAGAIGHELLSLDTLRTMQVLNIPILLVGKGMQAAANWRNGSTGQLSAVTCFMLFFGSTARIFTSWQETGDATLILTYVLSSSANAVIVAQLLWYWNAGATKAAGKAAAAGSPKKSKAKAKKTD